MSEPSGRRSRRRLLRALAAASILLGGGGDEAEGARIPVDTPVLGRTRPSGSHDPIGRVHDAAVLRDGRIVVPHGVNARLVVLDMAGAVDAIVGRPCHRSIGG